MKSPFIYSYFLSGSATLNRHHLIARNGKKGKKKKKERGVCVCECVCVVGGEALRATKTLLPRGRPAGAAAPCAPVEARPARSRAPHGAGSPARPGGVRAAAPRPLSGNGAARRAAAPPWPAEPPGFGFRPARAVGRACLTLFWGDGERVREGWSWPRPRRELQPQRGAINTSVLMARARRCAGGARGFRSQAAVTVPRRAVVFLGLRVQGKWLLNKKGRRAKVGAASR